VKVSFAQSFPHVPESVDPLWRTLRSPAIAVVENATTKATVLTSAKMNRLMATPNLPKLCELLTKRASGPQEDMGAKRHSVLVEYLTRQPAVNFDAVPREGG
jgi:hypothetical protein